MSRQRCVFPNAKMRARLQIQCFDSGLGISTFVRCPVDVPLPCVHTRATKSANCEDSLERGSQHESLLLLPSTHLYSNII